MRHPWKSLSVGGSVVATLLLAGSVGLGVSGLSASVAGAASPSARSNGGPGSVTNYGNKLEHNTSGWCQVAQGCNGQQGSGDYGTIAVVKDSFSNDGGYGAAVPGPGVAKRYARVSGAGTDVTSPTGCASPGSENCTGPYVLYGGSGTDSIFPSNGFTSSVKVYLDTAWADANPGQVVDWDVSLNDNTGSFLIDTVFNLCSTSDNGGGFYISTSNNAGGCSTGPTEITTSGWYTFEQLFSPVGGKVSLSYIVTNSSNTITFSSIDNTGFATSAVGGPNYGWFPDEDVQGLPVADILLKVNHG